MASLYIRARLVNAYRRVFPHPAVIAKRERKRVAVQAASAAKQKEHAAVISMAARLRGEAQG